MGASMWMDEHYCCDCEACRGDTARITYNCSPMLLAAGHIGHNDMRGVLGSFAVHLYNNILVELQATPTYFETMNPKNGWGNYEGTVEFIKKMIAMCQAHPEDVIDGSI